MDLKNNRITVGELLDYPAAKDVVQSRFPTLMKHPLLRVARGMTLEQLLVIAKGRFPPDVISEVVSELRRV